MGDDERFDYLYKFVSDEQVDEHGGANEHNLSLLDDGTLFVARFTGDSPAAEIDGTGTLPADGRFDGTGEWIPLARGTESFVPGFSAEDVYVFTWGRPRWTAPRTSSRTRTPVSSTWR
jgi:hypothetical protein